MRLPESSHPYRPERRDEDEQIESEWGDGSVRERGGAYISHAGTHMRARTHIEESAEELWVK